MRAKVITGVTGDQRLSPCMLDRVRVGGTANLVGAVQIKQGGTVIETIPVGATPGTERVFETLAFGATPGDLDINMANASDTVLVLFN